MDTVELLLHPVRLRIVHAMSGGRALTTSQLRARMPDVSKATMYRQVGLLADGGILEVDGEQKVGGTIERRYRLRQPRPVIDAETAASASLMGRRRHFSSWRLRRPTGRHWGTANSSGCNPGYGRRRNWSGPCRDRAPS